MRLFVRLRGSDPLLFVVAALLAAAVLVVYLQHQALADGQRQREVILRTMAEHHAEAAAREIQRTLEAPLFDTLSAVNHPLLRVGRHDLVAARYADGLQEYPQVDRFFLWIDSADTGALGDILFFDRSSSERPASGHLPKGFYRDTLMSDAIRSLALEHAGAQRIYLASERSVAGRTYDIVVRLFWVDAGRETYFALLGFVVDHEAARSRMFEELYKLRLGPLLAAGPGGPAFTLQVLDQDHRVAFGAGDGNPGLSARAEFPLRFYPRDVIEGRLASETPVRTWQVQVAPASGARHPLFASVTWDSYWRSAGPVLLIVIAIGFMVQSRRRAAELARMQSTFISHVSHQLKTPLSLLSAAAESLALDRVRTPDKRAQYLAIMRSETARLSLLVERVLEFSKLEQGRRTYEFEVTDLVRLVHETAEAFEQTLADKGFLFTIETPETPIWVRADPAAFEQVLVNLLDNAVKYSGDHRVIAIRVGQADGHAFFEVADRGIGIQPVEIGRIFERFYRGANASSDRRGFGLGLAIADEIVRAHRGRIDVSARLGRGTRFHVSLDLLRDQREGATVRPEPAAELERLHASFGGPQSR